MDMSHGPPRGSLRSAMPLRSAVAQSTLAAPSTVFLGSSSSGDPGATWNSGHAPSHYAHPTQGNRAPVLLELNMLVSRSDAHAPSHGTKFGCMAQHQMDASSCGPQSTPASSAVCHIRNDNPSAFGQLGSNVSGQSPVKASATLTVDASTLFGERAHVGQEGPKKVEMDSKSKFSFVDTGFSEVTMSSKQNAGHGDFRGNAPARGHQNGIVHDLAWDRFNDTVADVHSLPQGSRPSAAHALGSCNMFGYECPFLDDVEFCEPLPDKRDVEKASDDQVVCKTTSDRNHLENKDLEKPGVPYIDVGSTARAKENQKFPKPLHGDTGANFAASTTLRRAEALQSVNDAGCCTQPQKPQVAKVASVGNILTPGMVVMAVGVPELKGLYGRVVRYNEATDKYDIEYFVPPQIKGDLENVLAVTRGSGEQAEYKHKKDQFRLRNKALKKPDVPYTELNNTGLANARQVLPEAPQDDTDANVSVSAVPKGAKALQPVRNLGYGAWKQKRSSILDPLHIDQIAKRT